MKARTKQCVAIVEIICSLESLLEDVLRDENNELDEDTGELVYREHMRLAAKMAERALQCQHDRYEESLEDNIQAINQGVYPSSGYMESMIQVIRRINYDPKYRVGAFPGLVKVGEDLHCEISINALIGE